MAHLGAGELGLEVSPHEVCWRIAVPGQWEVAGPIGAIGGERGDPAPAWAVGFDDDGGHVEGLSLG